VPERASRAPIDLTLELIMDDLIEALTIFKKYIKEDAYAPTHCEHDVFMVCAGIREDAVSAEDTERLEELGFSWDESYDCWSSFRFGSC